MPESTLAVLTGHPQSGVATRRASSLLEAALRRLMLITAAASAFVAVSAVLNSAIPVRGYVALGALALGAYSLLVAWWVPRHIERRER